MYLSVLLSFLAFICCANASTYIVTAPKIARAGLPYDVSVNLLTAVQGSTVLTATIQKKGGTTPVTLQSMSLISGSTGGKLQLAIPTGTDPGSDYTLSVDSSSGFRNSTDITIVAKSKSVFIQTDKGIYKPGQTVHFRVVCVKPDLKPCTGNVDVEIFDSQNNKIKQWIGEALDIGVFTNELELADQVVQDDWKIRATIDDEQTDKPFTVEEYVLPKFEVKVALPSYYLNGTFLRGKITSSYTYGKPVKGSATVRASLQARFYGTGKPKFNVKDFAVFNGEADFFFTYDDLRSLLTSSHSYETDLDTQQKLIVDGQNIIVEANVTEALTQLTQSGNESVKMYTSNVKLEWLENPDVFKAGSAYTGYLKITQPDGSPIPGEWTDVQVYTVINYNKNELLGTYNSGHLNANGVLVITTTVPEDATSLSLNAYYHKGQTGEVVVSKTPKQFKSHSNENIQVKLLSSSVQAGGDVQFEVKLTTTTVSVFYYQIISRGNIIISEKSTMSNGRGTFTVAATQTMAPSSRVVVFAVVMGEVVSDSLDFSVAGGFNNQVTLNFKNSNGNTIHEAVVAQNINVDVTARPQSFVGILAVDQSVLLLKGGNDITKDEVLKELESYDPGKQENGGNDFEGPVFRGKRSIWWPYFPSGKDSAEVFKQAGVVIMTDFMIYSEPDYNYNWQNMEMAAGAVDGNIMFKNVGTSPEVQDVQHVRKYFPETWLWSNVTIGDNGQNSISTTVPDTITSWITTAFAINSNHGLGVVDQPTKLTAFRPFFVSLNLPYSVVRGEELAMQAIIFNYMDKDLEVFVTLEKSNEYFVRHGNDIETQIPKSQKVEERIIAKKGGGSLATFVIVPQKLGNIKIKVQARSTEAADGLERMLLIEAEGMPESHNNPVFIDLSAPNSPSFSHDIDGLSYPPELVMGSERIEVTVIGDMMGPSLQGLDDLLRMPYGCGEQNMLSMVPNIFALKYMTATSQDNSEIRTKAKKFMESGYQKELTYRHDDGSFSAFGKSDDSGSMWLTAFVLKSFNQAKPYIYVDDAVLKKAIMWILNKQSRDGSFGEPGRVIHTEMQGGSAAGVSLTAFVLIALEEDNDLSVNGLVKAKTDAVTYLEGQLNSHNDDPYALAIMTYALTLARSAQKDAALNKLNALAIEQDGLKHWEKASSTPPPDEVGIWRPRHRQSASSSIEMSSYGLLTYVNRNEAITGGLPIAKWLTMQRNGLGGFASTQDTVLGLQSLSELAAIAVSDQTNMQISVSYYNAAGTRSTHNFQSIMSETALLLQSVELPSDTTRVVVNANGQGIALVSLVQSFNTKKIKNVPELIVDIDITNETSNYFNLNLCGSWNGDPSGMMVMEAQLPSGFGTDKVMIEEQTNRVKELKRVEVDNKKITLYYDELVNNAACIKIPAQRVAAIANVQDAAVKAYRYYEPEKSNTVFYLPQALRDASICDACGSDCPGCSDPPPNTTPKVTAGSGRVWSSLVGIAFVILVTLAIRKM